NDNEVVQPNDNEVQTVDAPDVGFVSATTNDVTVVKPKAVQVVKKSNDLNDQIRSADLPLSEMIVVLKQVYGVDQISDLNISQLMTKPIKLKLVMNYNNLKKLKISELKAILKTRKEKVGGKKEVLIQRILNPTQDQTTTNEQEMPLGVDESGTVSNIVGVNVAMNIPELGPLNTLDEPEIALEASNLLAPLGADTLESIVAPLETDTSSLSNISLESVKSPLDVTLSELTPLESVKSPLDVTLSELTP
ncbi:unnamed protein product, partial [marine sediment metagenome]